VAEPIEYQILTNLRDALTQIAVGAGYYYDLRGTAVKLDPEQDVEALIAPDGPRPFAVIEVAPERREYMPAHRVRITHPWAIHWVHDSDPTQDEDRLETFFRGCADVEKAIAADISRGGLAIDTTITNCALENIGEGSQVWAVIRIAVTQIRTFGEPSV
jgi:hypothetical protein